MDSPVIEGNVSYFLFHILFFWSRFIGFCLNLNIYVYIIIKSFHAWRDDCGCITRRADTEKDDDVLPVLSYTY